jgi:hypothetical protein
MKRLSHLIALAAMTGSLSIPVWAGPDDATKATRDSSTNSLRVVRDEATGELRAPNTEELKALLEAESAARASSARSRSVQATATAQDVLPEEKTVKSHTNGMKSVKLGQESLTAIKVENTASGPRVVHADGTLVAPVRAEK